jgi:hypothetical protein
VIAVGEAALAISLAQTLEAGGLTFIAYQTDQGLDGLPLSHNSTLIVDRGVLPRHPRRFIDQLRRRLWSGLAIVLTEDAAAVDIDFEGSNHIKLIEKPFGSAELLAMIPGHHFGRPPTPAVDEDDAYEPPARRSSSG